MADEITDVRTHRFALDDSGEINEWAYGEGYHNGPYCEACWQYLCVHCQEDYLTQECYGGDPDDEADA